MEVLSIEDEGKFLMDAQGEQIGIVTEVDPEGQIAYVEPDPDLTEAWVQGLGFGDADEDDIAVAAEIIGIITDSELRMTVDL